MLDLQSNTIYYQDLQSANIFVVNENWAVSDLYSYSTLEYAPNLRFKGLLSGFLSLEVGEVRPMNVRRFAGHFCDFWRWGVFVFVFVFVFVSQFFNNCSGNW